MRAPQSSPGGLAIVAIATIALSLGCPEHHASPGRLSEAVMHSLVDGYAHAIETNNRELALWFVHPRAPSRSELDTELHNQLESHQERARTTHLEAMLQVDGSASATVDQDFIRIVGLKFIRDHRRRVFHFRTEGDVWRIWAIAEPEAQ